MIDENDRTKGDYDAYFEFAKEEVELMFSEMQLFIEKVNELV